LVYKKGGVITKIGKFTNFFPCLRFFGFISLSKKINKEFSKENSMRILNENFFLSFFFNLSESQKNLFSNAENLFFL